MQGLHRILAVTLLGLSFLSTGCKQKAELNDAAVAVTPVSQSVVESEEVLPSFDSALNEAMNAANKVQEANRAEEWHSVMDSWQSAITQLQALPESNPNYVEAQQKIQEYRSNFDYAKQNFLTVSLGDTLVNPASSPDEIQSWIDQGANPRYSEPNFLGEQTAKLYYAATFGNDHAVRILLNEGATWDQLTSEQLDDALIGASCNGFFYNVQELLKAGANPNGLPDNDEKPLAMSRSGICREVDMNGPIAPGSRQHSAIEAALRAAGAK